MYDRARAALKDGIVGVGIAAAVLVEGRGEARTELGEGPHATRFDGKIVHARASATSNLKPSRKKRFPLGWREGWRGMNGPGARRRDRTDWSVDGENQKRTGRFS